MRETSPPRKSTGDLRNFDNTSGIITLIRIEGTKAWDFTVTAKDSFLKLRMTQVESSKLRKLAKTCSEKALVLIHSSLYRVLKLAFPTDVSGIVTHGRVTSNLRTGSLGQSVGVLTPADFHPVWV